MNTLGFAMSFLLKYNHLLSRSFTLIINKNNYYQVDFCLVAKILNTNRTITQSKHNIKPRFDKFYRQLRAVSIFVPVLVVSSNRHCSLFVKTFTIFVFCHHIFSEVWSPTVQTVQPSYSGTIIKQHKNWNSDKVDMQCFAFLRTANLLLFSYIAGLESLKLFFVPLGFKWASNPKKRFFCKGMLKTIN